MDVDDDEVARHVGSTCQRERERGIEGTGSGFASWAAGFFLFLGRRVPRVLFYFFPSFLFLSFLFSIYFISFSNMVQIASNQFVKIPKIQSNIPEQ
jgi:hypothetical protein